MESTYHHKDLRRELIEVGIKILSRDGVAAFSLRRLSRELGVSHAAAYRHFADREALLEAIMQEAGNRFRQALQKSADRSFDKSEALAELGAAYVRFYLDNPEILTLFTLIPASGMASVFSSSDCDFDSLPDDSPFGIFRGIARSAMQNPSLQGLDEREILLGYWAKVHGLASILVTQKSFIPEDQLDTVIERQMRAAF